MNSKVDALYVMNLVIWREIVLVSLSNLLLIFIIIIVMVLDINKYIVGNLSLIVIIVIVEYLGILTFQAMKEGDP